MNIRSAHYALAPVVVLAWMATVGSACHSPAARPATPAPLTLVPHVFHTDDGQLIPAELGRLTVPENRGTSSTRTIDIAFVRFKSTSKTPGPPLFLLEGGPGGSGIDNTRSIMYPLLPVFLEAGDVITFDQRGVGLSRPTMDCPNTWAFPLDAVRTRETLVAVARDRARACAAFWAGHGVDVTAYHSNASADDIDAIRAALGAEKMALLGGSYGSHLTLATIRRHGARVSRAIMNGTEGPDHTLKLPGNVQKQVETVARLVAADAAMHRLIPDFEALMRSALGKLERAPVSVMADEGGRKVPVTLSRFDLQVMTAQNLGSTRAIRQLPAAYYDMAHGDFSWLADQILKFSRMPFASAMTLEMDCASGVSTERAARVRAEAGQTLLADVTDLPFQDVCTAWPTHDLGPVFRGPLTSSVPVLFISGTVDGRTPAGNAEELRGGFATSTHIVVENAGHGDRDLLIGAPEVRAAVGAFLKGETVTTTKAALPALKFAWPATAGKPR